MREPRLPVPPSDGKFECPDAEFLSSYPGIAEALCSDFYEKGKPRERSGIRITMKGDSVTVTLSEPTKKMYSCTTAEGVTEALHAVEAAIQADTLAWRKSNF